MQFVAESRADGLLDPVAVPVVDVTRRDTAAQVGQAILRVVGQQMQLVAYPAHRLVAVGVIAIAVAPVRAGCEGSVSNGIGF